MMMNWGHLEDTFLAQLVRTHLQDHRESFDYKYSSDERQQQFLLDNDGDRADRAAQGQRSDVTHENVCGMGVVPEKADRRAYHRAAKYCEFGDLRHALQFEIGCESRVAAHISEDRQGTGCDHRASDRQTIKAVR